MGLAELALARFPQLAVAVSQGIGALLGPLAFASTAWYMSDGVQAVDVPLTPSAWGKQGAIWSGRVTYRKDDESC
jgi:hypothetical protein